jgi:hypothetical protein
MNVLRNYTLGNLRDPIEVAPKPRTQHLDIAKFLAP